MKQSKTTNRIISSHEDYLIVDISTPTHTDANMVVDADWFNNHKAGVIYAYKDNGGKLYATFMDEAGKAKRVHRDIVSSDEMVDHINGDTLDNRRCNLRPCTNQQNQFNAARRKDNKSGRKGVYFQKDIKRWIAYGRINGKRIHIGCFKSYDCACKARDKFETENHGEFKKEISNA